MRAMAFGDHRFDGIAAVAPRRVHVQVAADMRARNQRQPAVACGGDFVVAVTTSGGDERKIEQGIQIFFARGTRRIDATLRGQPRDGGHVRDRSRQPPDAVPACAGSENRTPSCARSGSR